MDILRGPFIFFKKQKQMKTNFTYNTQPNTCPQTSWYFNVRELS
jgi:hypothetical protein